MPTIKLHIQNQEIFIEKPNQKIIANSKGYLKFTVDWIDNTDWEDLWRYAEFTWNRQNYIVALPSFTTTSGVWADPLYTYGPSGTLTVKLVAMIVKAPSRTTKE